MSCFFILIGRAKLLVKMATMEFCYQRCCLSGLLIGVSPTEISSLWFKNIHPVWAFSHNSAMKWVTLARCSNIRPEVTWLSAWGSLQCPNTGDGWSCTSFQKEKKQWLCSMVWRSRPPSTVVAGRRSRCHCRRRGPRSCLQSITIPLSSLLPVSVPLAVSIPVSLPPTACTSVTFPVTISPLFLSISISLSISLPFPLTILPVTQKLFFLFFFFSVLVKSILHIRLLLILDTYRLLVLACFVLPCLVQLMLSNVT